MSKDLMQSQEEPIIKYICEEKCLGEQREEMEKDTRQLGIAERQRVMER